MPAVEQDLTQGSVTRKLVRYALPLVASSLLQAIYSITDIIIAGHYIGDVGISAINNASIIMNMLTQLAIGLTVGGNVLVGQYFGSGDHENRRKAAGNMLTVGLIAGLLFAAGILLLGRPLLILLQSPHPGGGHRLSEHLRRGPAVHLCLQFPLRHPARGGQLPHPAVLHHCVGEPQRGAGYPVRGRVPHGGGGGGPWPP